MNNPSHYIRVKLLFPAMPAPVEVLVPWNILPYLDTHSDRRIEADGEVVYRRPRPDGPVLLCACAAVCSAA